MISKPAGPAFSPNSTTQIFHEPLPIADILPGVLARYGANDEGQQACSIGVQLSQAELDARYFEQQRRRSCPGCGEEEFL